METDVRHGVRIQRLAPCGGPFGDNPDTLDLLATASYDQIDIVVVPVERLDPEFFRLQSLVAGEILRRVAAFRLRLVILGDVEPYTADAGPFADFVRESNRGTQLWFVVDEGELEGRLVGDRGDTQAGRRVLTDELQPMLGVDAVQEPITKAEREEILGFGPDGH